MNAESHLLGIRYWFQSYVHRVPYYEVFEYVGRDDYFYFFQSIVSGHLIGKSIEQLNEDGFRPFCIDYKRIMTALDELERKSHATI